MLGGVLFGSKGVGGLQVTEGMRWVGWFTYK